MTQQRAKLRRTALLQAAVDLLTEGGFAAVTHRNVAHRAALPLAATTYYFTSRHHLLTQAFAQLVETELATTRTWITHGGLPALARHITADRNRQLALWELYVHAGRDPHLQQIARRWSEGCQAIIADALALPPDRARQAYADITTRWLEHVVEQRPINDFAPPISDQYTAQVLKPTYPITTERLVLRPFVPGDLDALHAYYSRADVARYLYWEPHDPDATRTALDRKTTRTALLDEGDVIDLAITLDDHVIGNTILIWTSKEHRQGEIGYILHPDHHGRGYAAEAAREMLRLGFEGLDLHRIVGRLDARNNASAAVLQRLDLRREAELVDNEFVKGHWATELVYAQLAREWHTIHHLALASDWQAAQQTGEYRTSTLGRTLEQEGFIHASRDHAQLTQVAKTFYRDVTEPLVVLDIDTHGLDVRTENGFPHLYGPLPTTAVTATHPHP